MGKVSGSKPIKTKKPSGRPTIEARIKKGVITPLEKRYSEHRASGLSIAEAAKAVNMPEREMFSRERTLPALKGEIETRRGERFNVDMDKMSALQFKLLTDLDKKLTDLLMSDKLTIADIAKGYEMLHQIKADQETIIEQNKQDKEKTEKPKSTVSFDDLVAGLSEEDRKSLDKCATCEYRMQAQSKVTRPKRRLLRNELSVVPGKQL